MMIDRHTRKPGATCNGYKKQVEKMIKEMITSNKENLPYNTSSYDTAYTEGYNDALVDLLNKLGIKHNETIMND